MKEDVLKLTKKLISQKSYSGNEENVSKILKNFFDENGFDEVKVDKYGNTIGIVDGNKPGKTLLFEGHMDTVPIGKISDWDTEPFEPTLKDNKIYGRGASDMKGALAAMAVATAEFAEESKRDFPGKIAVAGVVQEECFEGVASRNISKIYKPDYVVIGEASQLNLKIGQRGRAEIQIEVFGKPAHSANPEKGINAVYKMCKIIDRIRKMPLNYSEKLGKGIIELVDIRSEPYPGASVVPEYCIATFDRRLLVNETPESVMEPIKKIINNLKKEDPELDAKAFYTKGTAECFTGEKIEAERFFPGWIFDENEEYIQSIYNNLKKEGYDPEITNYNFCTNGSHYAGEMGIKTIGLGPSKENLAHITNEYISVDDLYKVLDYYKIVMKSLLK